MNFVFKTEWLEAISMLKPEQQAEAFSAITSIVTTKEMPEALSFEVRFLLTALFSQIVDGCEIDSFAITNKGGAPKGNKNAQKNNRKQPNSTENNLIQPKTTQNNVVLGCFSEKERDKEPSSPTPPLTETEKEKDKENINYVDTKESEKESFPSSSTPSFSLLPMSAIEDGLMDSQLWVESMCYKYSLDREQLAVQIHGFVREWVERGDERKELKDAKRHADALLNIRQRDGCLAAAPHWNEFLRDLMLRYVDDVGYDYELVAAFGKHYIRDVGGGKPYFLGIPKFEERLKEIMTAFKAEYKQTSDECTDQPGGRAESA